MTYVLSLPLLMLNEKLEAATFSGARISIGEFLYSSRTRRNWLSMYAVSRPRRVTTRCIRSGAAKASISLSTLVPDVYRRAVPAKEVRSRIIEFWESSSTMTFSVRLYVLGVLYR